MTDTETKLFNLLYDRCYKEGKFQLSSGDVSDYYFDGKMIEMSSEGAFLIGQVIYDRTKDLNMDAIGGLEIGAVPLTTAAVHAYFQHDRSMEGFFVRNEAKKHGTKKIIEGQLRHGSKVVIVDDVVTRGQSILKAVAAVKRAECQPILILVLVDRLEGAAKEFQKLGIRYQAIFTIEDFAKNRRL